MVRGTRPMDIRLTRSGRASKPVCRLVEHYQSEEDDPTDEDESQELSTSVTSDDGSSLADFIVDDSQTGSIHTEQSSSTESGCTVLYMAFIRLLFDGVGDEQYEAILEDIENMNAEGLEKFRGALRPLIDMPISERV